MPTVREIEQRLFDIAPKELAFGWDNVGQLLVASLILQTGGLMFYAFVLMFSAVITGVLTGIAGKQIVRVLRLPGATGHGQPAKKEDSEQ